MIDWNKDLQMYEILVPASSKEQKFTIEHHRAWDAFVTNITGGLTISRCTKGTWFDRESGEVIKDRMIPVKIACTRKQIKEIMNFTLEHYAQIEVIAYPISQEVMVVRKTSGHKFDLRCK
jgi:hypothetical protein